MSSKPLFKLPPKTRVVRLKRSGGRITQNCDVYIGRACNMGGWNLKQSIWHNPFTVKKYGRQGCIKMYEEYIKGNKELMSLLPQLCGKTLGCWCSPQPCHGDVLARLANELAAKQSAEKKAR